jgi:hypothetical protein
MAKKSKAKLESASADSAEPSPFSRTVVFARRPSTSGSMTRGHLVLDCGHSIEWGGGAESAAPTRVVCTTCSLAAKPTVARVRRKR